MVDCVFCAIVSGVVPARIIAENDATIVIADRAPKAPIHWLVIPRAHIVDMRSIEPSQNMLFHNLCAMTQHVVLQYADNQPFKYLINNGFEAGQRVFHLHAHILIGAVEHCIV